MLIQVFTGTPMKKCWDSRETKAVGFAEVWHRAGAQAGWEPRASEAPYFPTMSTSLSPFFPSDTAASHLENKQSAEQSGYTITEHDPWSWAGGSSVLGNKILWISTSPCRD